MRFALALVALCACACGGQPPDHVQSAEEVGTLRASPLVVGRDGAYSAQVWGQQLWTFGDTFLDVTNIDGDNFVSNTFDFSEASVTDGGLDLADRLDDAGAPQLLLRPTADESAYDARHRAGADGGCDEAPCGGRWATWPGPTLFDADAGVALTFYALVQAAPGDFNFHSVGESLAVWSDVAASPSRPEPARCGDSSTLLFCSDEPGFGAAAAIDGSKLLTFGCDQSGTSHPCKLARVETGEALERDAWEFWDGHAWTSDVKQAADLFDGAPIMGLAFNAFLGAWWVVYAPPLDNEVRYRTAPAPTGPWSDEARLFVPDRKGHGGNTYDALPHPELEEEGGRVQYVTFSRSTGTPFGSEFAVVRVTLK